jgi:glycosyltransferase involved in cell wall biosynthesis
MTPKYVIVSPVRDEGVHLPATIDAVASQSWLPAEWIVIDDGSSDDTWSILSRAAEIHNWIRPVRKVNRGCRKSGGGVVEAFNQGLELGTVRDWDFLVKLDGDVSFDSDYFERCLSNFFEADALGIGGGLLVRPDGDGWVPDSQSDPWFHVRGATKIYRKECWDAIGGLEERTGWDTIDEFKANMLGWNTMTFRDIRIIHLKVTGAADGVWKDAVKNGLGSYITGYHPMFLFARSARHLFKRPFSLYWAGLLFGYLNACIRRLPRMDDPDLLRYVGRQQIQRILHRSSIYDEFSCSADAQYVINRDG